MVAPAQADDVLEADKLFTYVQVQVQQIRLWLVGCRRTRQILSFFLGEGSMNPCKHLWRKLPYEDLRRHSFSDFGRAYHCVPAATHQLVGKETGETAHIERLNNTFRQRLSRLVRKTLSFSKQEYLLNLHVKLFAVHYNLACINHQIPLPDFMNKCGLFTAPAALAFCLVLLVIPAESGAQTPAQIPPQQLAPPMATPAPVNVLREIKGIKLDMTRDEATALLGKPHQIAKQSDEFKLDGGDLLTVRYGPQGQKVRVVQL